MDTALKRAQQCTRAAQDRQARYANKRRRALEFEVGEYVLLDSSILRLRHGSKKLGHRFIGPYKILQRVAPLSYELEFTQDMSIHDVVHVSHLRPYNKRDELGDPPAFMPDGSVQYRLSKYLRTQMIWTMRDGTL